MPTCKNCGRKWSWFDSIKKLLRFRKKMKCNHCGEIQYQSTSSRNTTSLFVLFPIITIPFSVLFNLSPTSVLLLELAIIVVVILLMPFFLKLTDKDEPIWWKKGTALKLEQVRMKVSFRQGKGEKSKSKSEWRSHSNRARRKKRERVWIRVSFRQQKTKQAWTCLNVSLIRTGLSKKH